MILWKEAEINPNSNPDLRRSIAITEQPEASDDYNSGPDTDGDAGKVATLDTALSKKPHGVHQSMVGSVDRNMAMIEVSGGDIVVVQSDDNNNDVDPGIRLSVVNSGQPSTGKRPRGPPPKQANNVTIDAGDDIAVAVQPDSDPDISASASAPPTGKRPRGPPPKRPSSHVSATDSHRESDIVTGANAAESSSSSMDVQEANDGPDSSYLVSAEPNMEQEDNNQEEEGGDEDEDGIVWRRVEMDLADADVLLLPISPSEIPLQHQQELLQRQQEKLLHHRLQLQQQKVLLQQQLQHHQRQAGEQESQQRQSDEEQSPQTKTDQPCDTDLSALTSQHPANIVPGLSDISQQPPLLLTSHPPNHRSDHLPDGLSEHSDVEGFSEGRRSSEASNDSHRALPSLSMEGGGTNAAGLIAGEETTTPPQVGTSMPILSASDSGKRPRGHPPKRASPKAPPPHIPSQQPVSTDIIAIAPNEEANEQGQGEEGSSIVKLSVSGDGDVPHSDIVGEDDDEEDEDGEEEGEEDSGIVFSADAYSPPGAKVSVRFEPTASTSDDEPIVPAIDEEGSSAVDIDADTISLTVSELNRSGLLKLVRAVGRPHPVALSRTSRRLLPHLHSSPYTSSWRASEQETYLTDRIASHSKRRMDVQRGVRVANKSIKIDGVHVIYTIYLETTYPGLPPVPWHNEKNRTIWRRPVKGKKAPSGEGVLAFDTDTLHHVDAQSSLEINPPTSVMSLANQLSINGGDGAINGVLFDSAVVDNQIDASRLPVHSPELGQPSFASLTDSFVTHPLEARITIQSEPRTEEEKQKESELANNPFGVNKSDKGIAKNTAKQSGKIKEEVEEEEDEEEEEEEDEEEEEEEEEDEDDDSSSSDDEKEDDEGDWLGKEETEAEEEDLAAMFQRMGSQPVALESADDLLNEMFDTIAPNAIVAIDLYLPFGASPRQQQQQQPDPDKNPPAPRKGGGLPQGASLRLRIPKEDLFLLISDRRALLSVALRAAYRGFFDSAGEEETLAVEDCWDLIAHELMHKVCCHAIPDNTTPNLMTTPNLLTCPLNQPVSMVGARTLQCFINEHRHPAT